MCDCICENGNAVGRFTSSASTFNGVVDFADNTKLNNKVITGPSNNTVVPTAFVDAVNIIVPSKNYPNATVRALNDDFGDAGNNTFGWQLILGFNGNSIIPAPFLANNINGLALWCNNNIAIAVNSTSTINANGTATDSYTGTCRIKFSVDPSVAGKNGTATLTFFAILSVSDNNYGLAYIVDANPSAGPVPPPPPPNSSSYFSIPFNVSWFNVTETTTFEGLVNLNVSITAPNTAAGNAKAITSLTLTTTAAQLIDEEAEEGLTVASYTDGNITKAIFYVNTDPENTNNQGITSGTFSAKYKLTYGYLSDLISNMPKLGVCNEVDTAFNNYLSNLTDMFKNNSSHIVTCNALLVSDTVPTQIISLSDCIKTACCSNSKIISSIVKVINSILEDYDDESIGYKLSVLSKLNKLKSLCSCVCK